MLKSIALVALVGSVACQTQLRADEISQGRNTLYRSAVLANNQQANYGPPRAYEYGYQLDDSNGSHGHAEKRDDNGRVEGEYSINLGDGRVRVVKYVADENGYRADVSTDELGTESKNPNDVYIGSTAISGYEAALRYGPFAPPHVEQPLVVSERPQVQAINSQVALPTYGTFAGGQNAQNRQVQRQG